MYKQLGRQYQQLGEENQHLTAAGHKIPPAKRARKESDDNSVVSTDPILKLPENCRYELMTYLTGKELLTATEVSSQWKKYIEKTSSLMNRAMDQIVVKPDVKGASLALLNSLFDPEREKRPYKHMEAPFYLHSPAVNPISFFASSLETLKTPYNCSENEESLVSDKEDNEIAGCTLPNLWKLDYSYSTWDRLKKFECPELTHLMMSCNGFSSRYDELKTLLRSMPKLKYFHGEGYIEHPMITADPEEAPDDRLQPSIVGICIVSWSRLILDQGATLAKLEILEINLIGISLVLRDLKFLKSLSIGRLVWQGDEDFQENSSLEVLKIRAVCASPQNYDLNSPQRLFPFFSALKELVMHPIAQDIRFIGEKNIFYS